MEIQIKSRVFHVVLWRLFRLFVKKPAKNLSLRNLLKSLPKTESSAKLNLNELLRNLLKSSAKLRLPKTKSL